jgi:hypothetical protein
LNWLDELERRDPAYKGAYAWYCLNNCGTQLTERDEGWYCEFCGEPWSWAELQAADCDD